MTGGTRRVGLAIARALASGGPAHLILTSRNPESAEARSARAAIESVGASVAVERLELDDLGAVEAFAQGLLRSVPRLDVLVHNASSYDRTPLATLSARQLESAMRVNTLAPALLTRGLRELLEKSSLAGGAGVVAMADVHAMGRPRKDLLAYSASKAALIEVVRSLARELAPKIRVNAVAPGVVAWPEEGEEAEADFREAYLKRVPLGRAGTPEDAAEVVRWLALDAGYVTGEIVRVDGGRWLA